MMATAYAEGMAARELGRFANPYFMIDAVLAEAWHRGWVRS